MSEELPPVTFALFAYNQEKYIQEAVRAALAQDYPNLQVIVSDDCSSDRTYEIAMAESAHYQGRLTVRRNEANLGVPAHINRVMAIAGGELIVAAAGDDISERERCSTLVAAWLSAGKRPDSLYSSVLRIDKDGKPLGLTTCAARAFPSSDMFNGQRWLIGSSHAWTRRGFDVFGELPEWLIAEDKAIGFRSALLGGVLPVPVPLVRYRCHSDSISSSSSSKAKAEQSRLNLRAHQADLEALSRVVQGAEQSQNLKRIKVVVAEHLRGADARASIISEPRMWGRLALAMRSRKLMRTKDLIRSVFR